MREFWIFVSGFFIGGSAVFAFLAWVICTTNVGPKF